VTGNVHISLAQAKRLTVDEGSSLGAVVAGEFSAHRMSITSLSRDDQTTPGTRKQHRKPHGPFGLLIISQIAASALVAVETFGVDPQFDGTIRVSPQPAAFAPRAALRGVKMRNVVFDIELGKKDFKVLCAGKTAVAPFGRTISIDARSKSFH
jgi:hypothetical protein